MIKDKVIVRDNHYNIGFELNGAKTSDKKEFDGIMSMTNAHTIFVIEYKTSLSQ